MSITSATVLQEERICAECRGAMTLAHKGLFATVYVCPGCGCMLTIPPPEPPNSTPAPR